MKSAQLEILPLSFDNAGVSFPIQGTVAQIVYQFLMTMSNQMKHSVQNLRFGLGISLPVKFQHFQEVQHFQLK